MRLQKKLLVDHYIGGALAWCVNIVAQALPLFWKRDHTLTRAPRKILFMKFVGLGSIVRASFLLPAARARFPESKICFATFPGCAPLVKMYPEIDEVWVVREDPRYLIQDTIKLLWRCRKEGVDLIIDLEVHSKYSSLLSALSLALDRAGFAGISSRFRRGLYTHLVFWNPIRFVDHAYQQLGLAIGLERKDEKHAATIPTSAQEKTEAYIKKLGLGNNVRLIGINPNASELKLERRWPKEYFAKVIHSLPHTDSLAVLIVGSPSERAYTEELATLLKDAPVRVHNAAGELPFDAFCALLSKLSLLVTNDSGPLHLARSFGTPTVSLWGPTHPAVFSPRGERHISLYRPIYCSPCTHFSDVPPCAGDNQCLKKLSWERCARAVFRMLDLPLPAALAKHSEATGEFEADGIIYGYWQRDSAPLVPKIGRLNSSTARNPLVIEKAYTADEKDIPFQAQS